MKIIYLLHKLGKPFLSQGWCFFMHRGTILISGWYWADTECPYQIGIGTILNAHVRLVLGRY